MRGRTCELTLSGYGSTGERRDVRSELSLLDGIDNARRMSGHAWGREVATVAPGGGRHVR